VTTEAFLVIQTANASVLANSTVAVTLTGMTMGPANGGLLGITVSTSADPIASAGVESGNIGGQITSVFLAINRLSRVAGKTGVSAMLLFTTTAGGVLHPGSNITFAYPAGFFVTAVSPAVSIGGGTLGSIIVMTEAFLVIQTANASVLAKSTVTVTLTGMTMGPANGGLLGITVSTSADPIVSVGQSGMISDKVSIVFFAMAAINRLSNSSTAVPVTICFRTSAGGELLNFSKIHISFPESFFVGNHPLSIAGLTAIAQLASTPLIEIRIFESVAASTTIVLTISGLFTGMATAGGNITMKTDTDTLDSAPVYSGALFNPTFQLFRQHSALTGSAPINAIGIFTTSQISFSASLFRTACESTRWISSSQIVVGIPAGFGTELQVSLTHGLLSLKSESRFSYTHASVRSSVADFSSNTLKVTGSGFSTFVSSRTLNARCESIRVISKNSVLSNTVICASGSLLTDDVTTQLSGASFSVTLSKYSRLDDIKVEAVAPNGRVFTLMNERCFGCSNGTIRLEFSPQATKLLPVSQCVDGLYVPTSDDVVLSSFLKSTEALGSWNLTVSVFGAASEVTVVEGSFTFVTVGLRINVGSSACNSVVWTSDSSMNVSIPAGFGRSNKLQVANGVAKLMATNVTFSYNDPVLAGVNSSAFELSQIRTGSDSMIFGGRFFSFQDASPHVSIRSSSCQRSRWLSDTSVSCHQIRGGLSTLLVVTVGGVNSSVPSTLQRANPVMNWPSSPAFVPPAVAIAMSTGSINIFFGGFNFVTHGISPKGVIGLSSAAVSLWRSDSSVVAKSSQISGLSTTFRVSVEFSSSKTAVLDFLTHSYSVPDSFPSTGNKLIEIREQLFSVFDTSIRIRYGNTACESSKWRSASSLMAKLPLSGSSFLAATLLASFSTVNASLLQILSPKSSVSISNISLVNASGLEIIKGSGLGTSPPPAHFHKLRVTFGESESRWCSPLNWTSDSSIKCTFVGDAGTGAVSIPQDSLRNAVNIHFDFLNTCSDNRCVLESVSILNPGFVYSSKPLRDSLVFRFYYPFISSQISSGSSFSRNQFFSNQLIEIAFVMIYNNSQPFVSSSTLAISELIVDYYNSAVLNTSIVLSSIDQNLPNVANVVSSSKNLFGNHNQSRAQPVAIPAGSKAVTYNLTIALALLANREHPLARLSLLFILPDNRQPILCDSPQFTLSPLPDASTLWQRISILNMNATTGIFIAKVSLAPVIWFRVDLPPTFPLLCSELMFNFEASLVCRVLNSETLVESSIFVVERSCIFSPRFGAPLPLSKLCRISITRISLSDGEQVPSSARNVTQVTFSTTHGPIATALLIGNISQTLKGGSVIASFNGTKGPCVEVQLYDAYGNECERSGVLGELSASRSNEAPGSYSLIGNTTAVSSDLGRLSWCGVMTSRIALNVSFYVHFFGFNISVSGAHNVNSSGEVASVRLSTPLPANVSLLPGGALPVLTITLVDVGGNVVVFTSLTFIRVRIFSRRSTLTGRRLLTDGTLVEETSNVCPKGGPAYVPITSSVNISINSTACACTAGSSLIVFDIVVFENSTASVIPGSAPLLSFDVVVAPGPAVTFYLANAKNSSSTTFSKLINVTLVIFRDAGQNVNAQMFCNILQFNMFIYKMTLYF
jgi:hypothetical protein